MTASAAPLFVCEAPGVYRTASPEEIKRVALDLIHVDLSHLDVMNSPKVVADFMQLHIGSLPHEVFCVMFLDAHNRMLAFEQMFRGSTTQTMVYPREVVKRALELNAVGVALAHNHPSGVVRPSEADRRLTRALQDALALIDVRVVDHVIVSAGLSLSFAQEGLL